MGKDKVIKSTFDGPLDEVPRRRSSCCTDFVFLILLLTDFADFLSDWLFFVDVYLIEIGLVYGPVERGVVWAFFVFSVIGTFTFILEVINLWRETYHHKPLIDSDALSAIVIWIEDVPQIAISLYIATCREEPISVFQLAKAGVVLISIFVRIIASSAKYCTRKEIRSHHHVKYKALIFIGIILEAFMAGAIFFLTQTERGENGNVSFRVPTTIIEERFNDQRYFANVSIFLHKADLFDKGDLDPDKLDETINWVRLTSINHLRDTPDNHKAFFRFDYEQKGTDVTRFAIRERNKDLDIWKTSECYDINAKTAQITQQDKENCEKNNFFSKPKRLYIGLQYNPPGSLFRTKTFGDIFMNIKEELTPGGPCIGVGQNTESLSSSSNNSPITVHYFQTSSAITPQATGHFLQSGNSPRFFRNGEDMELANSLWKTGWRECSSTGRLGPGWDEQLKVDCTN